MKTKERIKIIEELCERNNIKIEWRKSEVNSGIAYIKDRKIIIPKPKSSSKLITCFHEISHILLGNIKPSYFEEYLAVKKSFEFMKEYKIPISRKIKKKEIEYVAYSLQQAIHRGLKIIIPEVKHFIKKDFPDTALGLHRYI